MSTRQTLLYHHDSHLTYEKKNNNIDKYTNVQLFGNFQYIKNS